MRILEVKPSQRKKGIFLVKLEDGGILRVTESELLRFSIHADEELSDEKREKLTDSAKISTTKVTAANMVGRRALSKKELTERLVKKGVEKDDAQDAADWMEEIGGVNDAAYAASIARSYGGRGYGPARIREELRRRGVSRELWDEAMEELPDREETLDRLIEKKCRGDALSDRREIKRVSDSLLRRGFSWGEVKDALRRYMDSLENMEEDSDLD